MLVGDAAGMHHRQPHRAVRHRQLMPQAFRKSAHREFRRAIRGLAGRRDDAEDRGEVDDMRLALLCDRCGRKARVPCTTPQKLMLISQSICAWSISLNWPSSATPALLMTMLSAGMGGDRGLREFLDLRGLADIDAVRRDLARAALWRSRRRPAAGRPRRGRRARGRSRARPVPAPAPGRCRWRRRSRRRHFRISQSCRGAPCRSRTGRFPRIFANWNRTIKRFRRLTSVTGRTGIAKPTQMLRRHFMGQAKPFRATALIVEDDPMQREMICLLLEESDFDVIECESAEAAELVLERAVGQPRPDDDRRAAGRQHGRRRARACREALQPEIEVIVTSGSPLPQELPEGASSGPSRGRRST